MLDFQEAVEGLQLAEAMLSLSDAESVELEEVGKRNNAADQASIQQAHDLLHRLGAQCEMEPAGKPEETDEAYGEAEPEPIVESVAGDPVAVTIHESGFEDGSAMVTLREAGATFEDAPAGQQGGWVTITPIKPGFGNSRDGFFYPSKTLREAVEAGVFNGRKMFRDHPTRAAEKELPERSTDRWIGTVKETTWDERTDRPRSKVRVYDQAAYQRFKDAPEEIAFSILGGGTARSGRVQGREARIVESLAKIRSVDWVTEAGAGGAIDFAESADEETSTVIDPSTLTAEQLRDLNPDLYAALTGDIFDDGTGDEPEAETRESALAARVDYLEYQLREAGAKEAAKVVLTESLRGTTLPTVARAAIVERFAESTVGDGFLYADETDLKSAIDREVAATQRLIEGVTGRRSTVQGLGVAPEDNGQASVREAVASRLADRFGDNSDAKPWRPSTDDAPDEAPIQESGRSGRGNSVQDRLAARGL